MLRPLPDGTMAAELQGEFARILTFCGETHESKSPGLMGPGLLSVVAGTG